VSASWSRPPEGAEGKDGSTRQTLLLAPCVLKKEETSMRALQINLRGDQRLGAMAGFGRRFLILHGTSLLFLSLHKIHYLQFNVKNV
jgi:hypothetical protein